MLIGAWSCHSRVGKQPHRREPGYRESLIFSTSEMAHSSTFFKCSHMAQQTYSICFLTIINHASIKENDIDGPCRYVEALILMLNSCTSQVTLSLSTCRIILLVEHEIFWKLFPISTPQLLSTNPRSLLSWKSVWLVFCGSSYSSFLNALVHLIYLASISSNVSTTHVRFLIANLFISIDHS